MQSRFSKKKEDLTRLADLPTLKDLEYLYSRAMQSRGRPIELTFSKAGEQFYMAAKCTVEKEIQWTFSRGEKPNSKIEWVHESTDISLINTLIMTAFPDMELAPDADHGNFYLPESGDEEKSEGKDKGEQIFLAAPRKEGSLRGSLADVPMDALLQSIVQGDMTGRLEVKQEARVAEIFFKKAVPVHASEGSIEGDLAVIELLVSWQVGEFNFEPDKQTDQMTIHRRLDSLLMQAFNILDQVKYLDSQGLQLQSRLFRAFPNLTEADFEQRLTQGVPVDMATQKRLYQAIGNSSVFQDVLKGIPLNKSEWIPILFNLFSCGLIKTDSPPPAAPEPIDENQQEDTPDSAPVEAVPSLPVEESVSSAPVSPSQAAAAASSAQVSPAPANFTAATTDPAAAAAEVAGKNTDQDSLDQDLASLEQFVASMKRTDTGLFTRIPFLYFMEQEYYRYKRYKVPFSLAQVRLARFANGIVRPLSDSALSSAIAKIEAGLRETDRLAHFGKYDLAILLPHTDLNSAHLFKDRLVGILTAESLAEDLKISELSISIGVGAMPEDDSDLKSFLGVVRHRQDSR